MSARDELTSILSDHRMYESPREWGTVRCTCREWSMTFGGIDDTARILHRMHVADAILSRLNVTEKGQSVTGGRCTDCGNPTVRGVPHESWCANVDRS